MKELGFTRDMSLSSPAIQTGFLQRKCGCGNQTVAGGECENCKGSSLQRKAMNGERSDGVPQVVHEVLSSPGRALDAGTRAYFEPRFARDFSSVPVSSASQQMSAKNLTIDQPSSHLEREADRMADSVMNSNEAHSSAADLSGVRIHTGPRAAESARAVGAKAYTVGSNIVFGEGEFAPGTQAGKHLLAHELTHVAQQNAPGNIQRKMLQRKKIATNYGEFETTRFTEAEGRGVEILLKFHPSDPKVNAKKIALSQSVRTTTAAGDAYAIGPNQAARMVGSGKSGAGYHIDAPGTTNNPVFYNTKNLGASQSLKDTPGSDNNSGVATQLGLNATYELGHCYRESETDMFKTKQSASLWDKPLAAPEKGRSKMFETAAFAIDGVDAGKYYGSVKWGFKLDGTNAAPTVTKSDIEEASKETPTANFVEAAKLWNKGKTQGTIVVTADPDARAGNAAGSVIERIAKGTKLKQLDTISWDNSPAIKAEVLRADGSTTGKIIKIKIADVKDAGDGAANKQLPVPTTAAGSGAAGEK